MPGFLAPETLVLILYFVVPGFVLLRTYDLIVPAERRDFTQAFVDVVAFSFAILAFWFWPFFALVAYNERLPTVAYYTLLFILTLLVAFATPVFLAYAFYKLRTEGFLKGKAPHPYPTSWDWFFFERADNYYLRFYVKEGEDFGGYYGAKSFATGFPNAQQIYVEEVWRLDEGGELAVSVEGTRGAIVNMADCTMIEFLKVQESPETSAE